VLSLLFIPYQNKEGYMFKIEFKGIEDNNLELSIFLPVSLVHTFTELFYSLKQVFDYSEKRVQIDNAYRTSNDVSCQSNFPFPLAYKEEFEAVVLKHYDSYFQSFQDSKKAISETRKAMSYHPWGHYQAVLDVVRASGRLKKRRSKAKGVKK